MIEDDDEEEEIPDRLSSQDAWLFPVVRDFNDISRDLDISCYVYRLDRSFSLGFT